MPVQDSRVWIGSAVVAAVLLAGCSSMNAGDCQQANWEALGYDDAADGRSTGRLDARAKACTEHGVGADRAGYLRGWGRGIQSFCTPARGQQWGESGRSYTPGYCPPSLEGAFLSTYQPALARHNYEEALRDLDDEMERVRRRIVGLQARERKGENVRAALNRERLQLESLRDQKQTEMALPPSHRRY